MGSGIIRPGVSNAAGDAFSRFAPTSRSSGFRGTAREHARYQRQLDCLSKPWIRSDWRGLHGAMNLKQPLEGRLPVKRIERGGGMRRFRGTCESESQKLYQGPSFLALRDRRLRAIYTRAGCGLVGRPACGRMNTLPDVVPSARGSVLRVRADFGGCRSNVRRRS